MSAKFFSQKILINIQVEKKKNNRCTIMQARVNRHSCRAGKQIRGQSWRQGSKGADSHEGRGAKGQTLMQASEQIVMQTGE
jgi:hypothetical protein